MDLMSFMEAMGTSNVPLIAAFFIGLMNAVSPCTLTMNITAVAYVSQRIVSSQNTLLVGLVYTLGRVIAYTAIASAIVYVGIQTQFIALFLQEYGGLLLGPFLIVTGLLMLGHINLGLMDLPKPSDKIKERLSGNGYLGGFVLGMVSSLAFCPFSAVLYFGMLIPLSVETGDVLFLPAAFGLATGLPVMLLSLVLVFAAHKLGEALHMMRMMEEWARRAAAILFILAGAYLILQTLGIITGTLFL